MVSKISIKILVKFFPQSLRRKFFNTEAVAQRSSVKKVFLEISQNSQKNICARDSFLIKLQACIRPITLLKKRLWHSYFPVNFLKFLRTPFFIEHLWWLFLLTDNSTFVNIKQYLLLNLIYIIA